MYKSECVNVFIYRSTENRSQSELAKVKSALDSDSASDLELAPATQVRVFYYGAQGEGKKESAYMVTLHCSNKTKKIKGAFFTVIS